ncbi:hypothetical protein I4F81_004307 [Pyropia yezoensis]|uniref:Uncharacterized protein n=1 Tax=Pyropia yezoensis TaxID=2788 RepID=A0ACC3BV18_PYRYE|nr:hypothetical protein I4F81_004307 [Neopyropia yezoensis]
MWAPPSSSRRRRPAQRQAACPPRPSGLVTSPFGLSFFPTPALTVGPLGVNAEAVEAVAAAAAAPVRLRAARVECVRLAVGWARLTLTLRGVKAVAAVADRVTGTAGDWDAAWAALVLADDAVVRGAARAVTALFLRAWGVGGGVGGNWGAAGAPTPSTPSSPPAWLAVVRWAASRVTVVVEDVHVRFEDGAVAPGDVVRAGHGWATGVHVTSVVTAGQPLSAAAGDAEGLPRGGLVRLAAAFAEGIGALIRIPRSKIVRASAGGGAYLAAPAEPRRVDGPTPFSRWPSTPDAPAVYATRSARASPGPPVTLRIRAPRVRLELRDAAAPRQPYRQSAVVSGLGVDVYLAPLQVATEVEVWAEGMEGDVAGGGPLIRTRPDAAAAVEASLAEAGVGAAAGTGMGGLEGATAATGGIRPPPRLSRRPAPLLPRLHPVPPPVAPSPFLSAPPPAGAPPRFLALTYRDDGHMLTSPPRLILAIDGFDAFLTAAELAFILDFFIAFPAADDVGAYRRMAKTVATARRALAARTGVYSWAAKAEQVVPQLAITLTRLRAHAGQAPLPGAYFVARAAGAAAAAALPRVRVATSVLVLSVGRLALASVARPPLGADDPSLVGVEKRRGWLVDPRLGGGGVAGGGEGRGRGGLPRDATWTSAVSESAASSTFAATPLVPTPPAVPPSPFAGDRDHPPPPADDGIVGFDGADVQEDSLSIRISDLQGSVATFASFGSVSEYPALEAPAEVEVVVAYRGAVYSVQQSQHTFVRVTPIRLAVHAASLSSLIAAITAVVRVLMDLGFRAGAMFVPLHGHALTDAAVAREVDLLGRRMLLSAPAREERLAATPSGLWMDLHLSIHDARVSLFEDFPVATPVGSRGGGRGGTRDDKGGGGPPPFRPGRHPPRPKHGLGTLPEERPTHRSRLTLVLSSLALRQLLYVSSSYRLGVAVAGLRLVSADPSVAPTGRQLLAPTGVRVDLANAVIRYRGPQASAVSSTAVRVVLEPLAIVFSTIEVAEVTALGMSLAKNLAPLAPALAAVVAAHPVRTPRDHAAAYTALSSQRAGAFAAPLGQGGMDSAVADRDLPAAVGTATPAGAPCAAATSADALMAWQQDVQRDKLGLKFEDGHALRLADLLSGSVLAVGAPPPPFPAQPAVSELGLPAPVAEATVASPQVGDAECAVTAARKAGPVLPRGGWFTLSVATADGGDGRAGGADGADDLYVVEQDTSAPRYQDGPFFVGVARPADTARVVLEGAATLERTPAPPPSPPHAVTQSLRRVVAGFGRAATAAATLPATAAGALAEAVHPATSAGSRAHPHPSSPQGLRVAMQNAASGRFMVLGEGGGVVTLRSPAWLKLKALPVHGGSADSTVVPPPLPPPAPPPPPPLSGAPTAAVATETTAAAAVAAPAAGIPCPTVGAEDDSLKSPLSVSVSAKGGIVRASADATSSSVFGVFRLSAISVSLSGWVLPSGLSKIHALIGVSLALDWTDLRAGTALPVLAPWPVRVEFDASPALPAGVVVEADVARVVLTDAFLLAAAHSARSFGRPAARSLHVFVFRNHTPAVVRFRVYGRSTRGGGEGKGEGKAGREGGSDGADFGDAGPLIEVQPGEVAPFDLPASLLPSAAAGSDASDSDLDVGDGGGGVGTDSSADEDGGGGGGVGSTLPSGLLPRRRRHRRSRRGAERVERREAVAAESARAAALAARRRMWVAIDGWGVAPDESFGTYHVRPLRVGGGGDGGGSGAWAEGRGRGVSDSRPAVFLWTVSEDVDLCINVAVHAPLQLFNRLPGHSVHARLDDGWDDDGWGGGGVTAGASTTAASGGAGDAGTLHVPRGGAVFGAAGGSAPGALRVRPGSATKAYGLSPPVDVARMRPGTALVFTSVSVAPSAELVNLLPVSMQFLLDDRRRREGLLSSLVRRVAEREGPHRAAGVADLAAVPFVAAPRLTRAAVAAATHRLAPPRGRGGGGESRGVGSTHSARELFSRFAKSSSGSSRLVTLAPGEVVPLLTVAPRRPYWVAVREPSGSWTAPLRFRRVDAVASLPLVAPVRPLELLPAVAGGGGGRPPRASLASADAEHLRLHVPVGADTAGGPSGLLSQAIRRLPTLGCVLLRAAITPVGSVRLSVDAPYRLSNQFPPAGGSVKVDVPAGAHRRGLIYRLVLEVSAARNTAPGGDSGGGSSGESSAAFSTTRQATPGLVDVAVLPRLEVVNETGATLEVAHDLNPWGGGGVRSVGHVGAAAAAAAVSLSAAATVVTPGAREPVHRASSKDTRAIYVRFAGCRVSGAIDLSVTGSHAMTHTTRHSVSVFNSDPSDAIGRVPGARGALHPTFGVILIGVSIGLYGKRRVVRFLPRPPFGPRYRVVNHTGEPLAVAPRNFRGLGATATAGAEAGATALFGWADVSRADRAVTIGRAIPPPPSRGVLMATEAVLSDQTDLVALLGTLSLRGVQVSLQGLSSGPVLYTRLDHLLVQTCVSASRFTLDALVMDARLQYWEGAHLTLAPLLVNLESNLLDFLVKLGIGLSGSVSTTVDDFLHRESGAHREEHRPAPGRTAVGVASLQAEVDSVLVPTYIRSASLSPLTVRLTYSNSGRYVGGSDAGVPPALRHVLRFLPTLRDVPLAVAGVTVADARYNPGELAAELLRHFATEGLSQLRSILSGHIV